MIGASEFACRLGAVARHTDNWWQLCKFGLVGGSGYLINLGVFAVSLASLGLNLVVLEALIASGGFGDVTAQAIAVAVAMPFNFIGNRLWTFA